MGLVLPLLGCQPSEPSAARSKPALSAQRQASQSNALFTSILNQLDTLPESSLLVLQPPAVILDARNSADGQDVLAIVTRHGSQLAGPHNLLRVPAGNAQFKANAIAPGDTIKYFVIPDRESMDRLRETGEVDIITMAAINLTVAQVLSNNELLIVGGLPTEVLEPAKLEVWRSLDDRMNAISAQLGRYATRRDPPLAWHPVPDESVVKLLTERLNQWLRQTRAAGAKRPQELGEVALLETLPKALRHHEKLQPWWKQQAGSFSVDETRQIQGATWVRDIARRACAGTTEPIEQATLLFDWTVRNLQLLGASEALPRAVWEILLHGRATAQQRAWVFENLCRQQNLDVALIEIPQDGTPYPLVGVLVEKGLALFDPTLGLPLHDAEGGIATLRQLSADDALLRRLDLEDSPYPVSAKELQAATLQLVAEPFARSPRAGQLENKLSGVTRLRLTIDIEPLADRLRQATDREATLWAFPYATLLEQLTANRETRHQAVKAILPFAWRPALWKGRLLQFRGRVQVEDSETTGGLEQDADDFRSAQRLYMSRSVRPKEARLSLERIGSEVKREIYQTAKATATLWLGHLAAEQEKPELALRWFENKALATPWAKLFEGAIRYNRARSLETLGRYEEAADLLETDTSPQRHGNRLRGAQLRAEAARESDDSVSPNRSE